MPKEELVKLWMEVFGDDREYIEDFFKQICHEKLIRYRKCKEEVIAALYMIEYEVYLADKKYKAMYYYALATRSEYRKHGIMTELINEANDYCDKNDYLFAFLIPAESGLIHFYKKFGFDKEFTSYERFDGYRYDYEKMVNKLKTHKKYILPDENKYDFYLKQSEKYDGEVDINNFNYDSFIHRGIIRQGELSRKLNVDLEKIIAGPLLM